MLRLWDTAGRSLAELSGHSREVRGALQLKNGSILSWDGNGVLVIWPLDGLSPTILLGHNSLINGALQLKDGRLLSWASEPTLRLWSVNGNLERAMDGHTAGVGGALQLNDGRILSWSWDKTLRLWSEDGEHLKTLNRHSREVVNAFQLKDGRLLSFAMDEGGTLGLWDNNGHLLAKVNFTHDNDDERLLDWAAEQNIDFSEINHNNLDDQSREVRNNWNRIEILLPNQLTFTFIGDADFRRPVAMKDSNSFLVGDDAGRVIFLKFVPPEE
jgi:WD40 repeat protein